VTVGTTVTSVTVGTTVTSVTVGTSYCDSSGSIGTSVVLVHCSEFYFSFSF